MWGLLWGLWTAFRALDALNTVEAMRGKPMKYGLLWCRVSDSNRRPAVYKDILAHARNPTTIGLSLPNPSVAVVLIVVPSTRAELGGLNFLRRQVFQIHFGGLDRGMPEPTL